MSTPEDTPKHARHPDAGKLPREVLTDPSRRSIAVLVLGALAIAWAANFVAMKVLEASPQNLGYSTTQAAWNRLETQDESPDWLVLGDSGCGQAIVTETLEEALGGPVVEVCTIGNMGLLDDAWMLGIHIERFGPPGAVLIVHVYDVWQRTLPPPGLLAQVPLPLGYWRRLKPILDLDRRQSVDVFMARHVPLVGERRSLKNLVKTNAARAVSLVRGARNESQVPDVSSDTASVVRDFRRHRAYASSTRFTISPTNLEALDTIVELADEHGFEVYIANGPLWDTLVADAAFQRYNAEVQAALAVYANRRPSVHHIDGVMTFDVHAMTGTVDHVRPEPAIAYSRDLARRIAMLRAGRANDYGR